MVYIIGRETLRAWSNSKGRGGRVPRLGSGEVSLLLWDFVTRNFLWWPPRNWELVLFMSQSAEISHLCHDQFTWQSQSTLVELLLCVPHSGVRAVKLPVAYPLFEFPAWVFDIPSHFCASKSFQYYLHDDFLPHILISRAMLKNPVPCHSHLGDCRWFLPDNFVFTLK